MRYYEHTVGPTDGRGVHRRHFRYGEVVTLQVVVSTYNLTDSPIILVEPLRKLEEMVMGEGEKRYPGTSTGFLGGRPLLLYEPDAKSSTVEATDSRRTGS